MVDIVTATVPTPNVRLWKIPPDPQLGLMPRGEVIFTGTQVLPELEAGDNAEWTLNMVLPRNFWFRVVEAMVQTVTDNAGDVLDPDAGMRVIVDTDAPGAVQWNFPLHRVRFFQDSSSPEVHMRIAFQSATENELMQFWHIPPGIKVDTFVDNSAGSARLFLTWFNDSPLTDPIDCIFRFRLLMYDVEQINQFPVHTPVPVIGA